MAIQMFRPVAIEQEPKKKNRFILHFPDSEIESYLVQTINKPSASIIKGKLIWEPIEITLIDVIGPSTSWEVFKWIKRHEKSKNIFKIIKNLFTDNSIKKKLILESLDPTGVVIEQWQMIGCRVKHVNFGKLDYDSKEVQLVSLIVEMDDAFLTP